MKKDLSLWQLFGATFTAVLGTLLHFVYEWTGIIAFAPFSAVNESTWEHMKILFIPMLIFAFVQYPFFRKDYENFWQTKLVGITLGTLLIPTLFYTYGGSFGGPPAWINILIFFLSAGAAFTVEGILFKRETKKILPDWLAITLLTVIAFAFVWFTFTPPELSLFQAPLSGGYGIQK